MSVNAYRSYYEQAYKLGKKNYSDRISKGESGTLVFLEGILRNRDIISEIYLGEKELPISKIIGTNSHARAISFSSDFLPIAAINSEFAGKWINVCKAHLEEGLRDSLKVYEYLNWYYVVEGNKRVSVLKFFDVYSYRGEITRLMPKYDENNKTIRLYYEFLQFNSTTNIRSIWFSTENSFNTILQYIEQFESEDIHTEDKYKAFERDVYLPFRKIYKKAGGGRLKITTGDALLEYLKLYGIPSRNELYFPEEIETRIDNLISELRTLENQHQADIKLEEEVHERSIVSSITSLIMGKKQYKVAFLYPKSIESSNWSYYHDLGRIHVQSVLKDHIKTTYFDEIPENNKCYDHIVKVASKGFDIIFAASPAFINGTLKAALEFEDIAFYNCSQSYSFKHVTTYFGRIFEAKFLSGIIAGSVSGSDLVGYIGTYPIPEVISCVNAFAIGLKTVRPNAKVYTEWLNQWDSEEGTLEIENRMMSKGIDTISHHNIVGKSKLSKGYGLYKIYDEKGSIHKDHLASPIWNFGIFYEKIISNYINQNSRMSGVATESKRSISFWWGMNADVVDIVYSNRLVPLRTRFLVDYLKQGIKSQSFYIFQGPVYDNNGILKIKETSNASVDELLSMEWFADNVITKVAKTDYLYPNTNLLAGKIE
jgi:basic membrane protein A and related proteins